MLLVRKTLTEIFLEVTDEKIQEISKSTLEKYRQKGSCAIAISLKSFLISLKQNLNVIVQWAFKSSPMRSEASRYDATVISLLIN